MPAEANAIDARVAAIESRTGVQICTAVIGRADNYVELPWKAFAFGAAFAAFALVVADAARPQWTQSYTALVHAAVILLTGAGVAMATVLAPPFARLFLRPHRRDEEVRQYAESLFLTRALFNTRDRTAVLILVSLFERRIEIHADTGCHARVGEADWQSVITRMTPHLRAKRPFAALEEALGAVDALLVAKGFQARPGGTDELPNRPIEERGR
jgi:putative membrane protein